MEVAMAQSISSNRKTAQQSLRAAAEDLAGEIATLNTLETTALLQKWKALFRH
jgi:F0F1-type ATP synthase membrane subunit b/b'